MTTSITSLAGHRLSATERRKWQPVKQVVKHLLKHVVKQKASRPQRHRKQMLKQNPSPFPFPFPFQILRPRLHRSRATKILSP